MCLSLMRTRSVLVAVVLKGCQRFSTDVSFLSALKDGASRKGVLVTEHTAEDWAQACDLKRQGREWVGPCPLCGGKGRFHVRDGGSTVLVGCRGCIDGRDPDIRRRRYAEIAQTVFGGGSSAPAAHWFDREWAGQPATARRRGPDQRPCADTDPAALWRSCTEATKTLAHA